MRKSRCFTIIFAVIMFVVSVCLIGFMPDQVATHFNIYGIADAFGSRYLYFIFPVLFTVIGGFLFGLECLLSRTKSIKDNGAWAVFNAGLMAFFLILNVLITVNGLIYGTPNAMVGPDFMHRIVFAEIGVFLVFFSHWLTMLPYNQSVEREVCGAHEPKLTEEQYDSVMQFTKKTGIIMGAVIAICALFFSLLVEIIVFSACMIIWAIGINVYVRRFNKISAK